jgi:branched-chain amino acid transport system substrate-binding protein
MSVVFEGSFRRADPDGLVNLATAMEAHQPEAVFFADSIGEATRFFTALKPSVRSKLIPLGPGSWDNEAQLNRAKTALEGAIFVTPFFASSRKEIIVRFVEAYQARFKLKPDFLAAQGFDAATVALAALRKQNTEGIPFVQALTSVERYEGLTGTIRVQQSGEFERNFDVVTLRDGAVIELQKQVAESFVVQGAGDIERSPERR